MNITILTDSTKSWFIPYGNELLQKLSELGHSVKYVHDSKDVTSGDVCFLLSCTKLVTKSTLNLNTNNIVVHASDLPQGKGFSPLQWQILEGKDEICLSLFEVVKDVDAGPIYLKSVLKFKGYEFYNELRDLLAKKIISMCLEFIKNRDTLKPVEQKGSESFYRRRTDEDDEISTNKTIKELFNHFRIADNENFPLYFFVDGKKFYIKVEPDPKNTNLEN